jgi:dihydrofolate synthase/folylpolyglutamate synthase
MNYAQAWAFLDNLQFFKIKLGLDSMSMFLNELGNPQNELQYVHVAGTNGKGSVAMTLLALLSGAGYRVGLYTSPHLHSVRERFRINNDCISPEEFAAEATRIRDILNGRQITYFEFTTALAFLWFQRRQVDIAVMEVGLGGRLDATNVIRPLVSIITNISMDHELYLGSTIQEIASEKAGIIKDGVPVVSGVEKNIFDAEGAALQVIADACSMRSAPLFLHGRDFMAEARQDGSWNYWAMKRQGGCRVRETIKKLSCSLKGRYQIKNAALALATLELLEPHGFKVDEPGLRQGLSAVQWPGRLEYFCLSKQNGAMTACEGQGVIRYLLDGAHNPAGVRSLLAALREDFVYDRLILVWGAMADKDLAATLPVIVPLAYRVILTRQNSERSATPEILQKFIPAEYHARVLCSPVVKEALALAAEMAGENDLICVSGSLYLIGEARGLLRGEMP